MEKENLTEKSYNEVLYLSKSFKQTQPIRINAIMQLFGFKTKELNKSRVLEIGCSIGGNLIPISFCAPQSEIIGLDLSEIQINEGKKIIEQIGIKNIKLYHKNIMDYNYEYGKFDYIICHGVFSWVDKNVQNKILEVIKNSLSENGIACVSYNTYPGWKNRDIIRDIMVYRKNISEKMNLGLNSTELINQGKEELSFLKQYSYINEDFKNYIDPVLEKDEYYLYHEYYEENNKPLYLSEFNNMLEKKELKHICDSEILKSFPIYKSDDIDMEEELTKKCGEDSLAKEQYYDFIYNRQFRISLLSHKGKVDELKVSREFSISNLNSIEIRGKFYLDDNKDYKSIDNSVSVSSDNKEIIELLNKNYPSTLSFSEIKKILKEKNIEDIDIRLFRLIYKEAVDIFIDKITINEEEKLKISDKYRKYFEYYLIAEKKLVSLSNFQGKIIELSKLELETILLFDGTNDDKKISDILMDRYQKGEITIDSDLEAEEVLKKFIKALREFIVRNLLYI
ncbi:MAG: class I SAM-dependent methyltransferase [Fusobacterium gastrosuis]|uniref:methyltransferase regulatory domain-containing protein n=1 Tax=Fusobacterium gastrosuis TaxID=1755100 RepID=UPI002A8CA145|nr:class I SAM-dependent methyltransferase [Fusobacterium gastrosuis]